MSVFMIIQAHITAPEKFRNYTAVVPALVARHGGKYLVLGGDTTVLEGQWTPWPDVKTVVSEWPDRASAMAFWQSDDYREAAQLRQGAGDFTIVLVDGIQLPQSAP
jgi:uncharacterized protein (DUF1330 family)